MPTDYEQVYQAERHALGQPFAEFVAFFDAYDKQNADVLDVGCGQGRDALFMARKGHRVVGVDLSPTGIAQLLEDAQTEGLMIEGIVTDLREYQPDAEFDVAVVDRTLHMLLDEEKRLGVLARICDAIREGGCVLIADERSNLPAMRDYFMKDAAKWTALLDKKGFLFMRKGWLQSI